MEEHFQVNAFEGIVPRGDWPRHGSRVGRNVDTLLEVLARHNALATFFVLGWVAARHPSLVRTIAAAGHEVASHGFWHRRITVLTPQQFREDVRDAKAAIENAAGAAVVGFRAPSFSIVPGVEWAFDVLLEEGHEYDSSIFPIHRTGYGYPGAQRGPHLVRRPSGVLREFPLATATWGPLHLPAAGGGYLRQLPFSLIQTAFRQHSAAGIPGVFYVHPWEIDPDQPRLAVPPLTRLRHYRGLSRTLSRIERLLAEFHFTSIARTIPLKEVVAA
ncbi:MAG: DUF3473 domain-containing protein [Gemmatimonadaceae bacterium]